MKINDTNDTNTKTEKWLILANVKIVSLQEKRLNQNIWDYLEL